MQAARKMFDRLQHTKLFQMHTITLPEVVFFSIVIVVGFLAFCTIKKDENAKREAYRAKKEAEGKQG